MIGWYSSPRTQPSRPGIICDDVLRTSPFTVSTGLDNLRAHSGVGCSEVCGSSMNWRIGMNTPNKRERFRLDGWTMDCMEVRSTYTLYSVRCLSHPWFRIWLFVSSLSSLSPSAVRHAQRDVGRSPQECRRSSAIHVSCSSVHRAV
jgi:hypothetical protein